MSRSAQEEVPPDRTFHRAFWLLVACMGAAILVLSLLVTTGGPRVRHVVVRDVEDGRASVSDQGLSVVLDRPVEGGEVGEAIKIHPEADYSVSHRRGQINISFEENLRSNTGYALTVGPALEDGTGRRMKRAYGYEFATAEPTYTYLERHYGPVQKDKIIERAPVSGKSRVLFEADEIERFARGEDHAAVVVPRGEDAADELHVVDIEGGYDHTVEVPGNVKIDAPTFSPVGDRFAFVTRVNIGRGADESYRKGHEGRLYLYDVAERRLRPADVSDGGMVESTWYSRDGQALLYGMLDGAYYLTDAAATAEPIPLGSHAGSGGFDRTNTRIVFRKRDGAAIYDAETGKLRDLPFSTGTGGSRSTPVFLHNSDRLLFGESWLDPETGEAVSRVGVAEASDERMEAQITSEPPEYFYGTPAVSFDDRYIMVQSASASDTFDTYASNAQPKDARILVHDRSSQRVIDEVRGIDPVWSR